MPKRNDISDLLAGWPYVPDEIQARLIKGPDGRELLQMRVDMGVLQLETNNRPDGVRPHGSATYYDYLKSRVAREGAEYELTAEECNEADREFVQFYHRRICWLALRRFKQAGRDADHTLALMDLVKEHSPDEQWTLSHEQYRPFVMFHRVQAAALALLDEQGPDAAIAEISAGLERFRELYEQYDAAEKYDDDEMVKRLVELRESMRHHYQVGKTLDEQLAEAVAAEKYELAAELRDEIAKRQVRRR